MAAAVKPAESAKEKLDAVGKQKEEAHRAKLKAEHAKHDVEKARYEAVQAKHLAERAKHTVKAVHVKTRDKKATKPVKPQVHAQS